ncbi:Venom factor [Dirofilaria immitis]
MLHCMDQTILTSHYSPTGPVLRANPYPEVTDLICRLPLPTLFYRLEAVHLGDLLRIWEPWRFTETTSLSPAEPIPGSPFLNQKRELWLGLYSMFPSSFALPR